MSFFKKLAKGILIGAAIGFTGGLALGALGIGTIGAVAVTIKGATIYGAVYGGLQGASLAFIKKQKMPTQEVQARSNISVDPQALGKWIFGETAAATDVVYSESVETKQVVHVIAAAAHEIDSYGELYINNTEAVVVGTDVTGEYAGVLKVFRNLGTTTQDALVIDDSLWPSTARGRGQAHYGLRWNFDTDAGKEKLSGGIPTRITQIVKGAKVYDPRLDTTEGGSGAQRADDQSTWEWSDNWALIVAHYLLGYKLNNILIYGVGTNPSDIDWQSVAEMADVCDQVVDGKPRYRIGGIFAITQDHENIIGQLESAIGGKVSKFGGKYYLWCPHNDLISAGTLTDANIIGEGGIQYTPAGPLESLFNTARGQYVEPTLLYQLQPYAEVIESTAVTEDGRERLLQKDFPMIQDASIAQRVSRELIRRSRFSGTITVIVGPIALAVQPFDIVTVNFRETNFTNELFRVISMQYSAGGAVIVELLEEDASIYDTSIALGTSLTQLDPDSYDPTKAFAVVGLTLTNVTVAGAGGTTIDGIRVSWNDPGAFVSFTEGGYRKVGDIDFIYGQNTTRTSAVIAPVQPGTSYEVRARHVSIEGVASAFVFGTITSGLTTKVGTAVIDDGAITNAKLDANAIAANKFASGIEPISIFANVPSIESTATIFVTSQAKLFRWNGSAYIKSVDDGDIVSITANKITAGTINAAITTTNILQLATAGKIFTAGKTSAASTTAGVFIGHDGGSAFDFAVGNGTKSIVFDGSAGTFAITGVDISGTGFIRATGNLFDIDTNAAVNGSPTLASATGVLGRTSTGKGVLGIASTTGTGVLGSSVSGTAGIFLGSIGVRAEAGSGTGVALRAGVGNLVMGAATNTGNTNLVIKEGVPGSRLNDQIIIYGQLSADSDTTLGLIVEQDVEAGTGSFAGLSQLRIHINGVAYKLPLEAY